MGGFDFGCSFDQLLAHTFGRALPLGCAFWLDSRGGIRKSFCGLFKKDFSGAKMNAKSGDL